MARRRRKADLKKQGKSGLDAPAPREALYLCMRERGNGADEPESPSSFSNEIRTAIKNYRKQEKPGLRAQLALKVMSGTHQKRGEICRAKRSKTI